MKLARRDLVERCCAFDLSIRDTKVAVHHSQYNTDWEQFSEMYIVSMSTLNSNKFNGLHGNRGFSSVLVISPTYNMWIKVSRTCYFSYGRART
jgi:hypothetical protein